MSYVTKEALGRLMLAERDEPSAVFGGTVCLRELTRAQYRAALEAARRPGGLDADLFNVGIVAAGAVDPATKEPMWSAAELLALPQRAEVWNEIARLTDLIVTVSEAGHGAVKSGGPADDAG